MADNFHFAGFQMPCPDQYYYKKGQAEIQYNDDSKGFMGYPEYAVEWNRLNIYFVQNAIALFNLQLDNGSWHNFDYMRPTDFTTVNMLGVLRKPTLAGANGQDILGFRLHFTHLNARSNQDGLGGAKVNTAQFDYGDSEYEVSIWNF